MSADPCGCGCCTPASGAAPLPVSNLPGLPAVGYRIGTYPTFREALVQRLAQVIALHDLTARDDTDYAIAVLDGWAVIADILTFYSERTVNEAFLRTAKLRDSVVRLAGLVGYDPDPGLAATTNVAYTVADGTSFTIPAGAKVQSVPPPGSNAPPVKFETLADLDADAALNRVTLVAPPVTSTALAAGATLALIAPGATAPASLRSGVTLAAWSSSGGIELKRAEAVTAALPAGGVSWSPSIQQPQSELVVVARPLRVFGYDAPASFVTTYYDTSLQELVVTVVENGAGAEINTTPIDYDFSLGPTQTLDLDSEYPDLRAGVELLVGDPASGSTVRAKVQTVTRASKRFGPTERTVTEVTLSAATSALDRRTAELYEIAADVDLWNSTLPATIVGATLYAALDETSAPAIGRAVELVDATSAYDAVVVSAVTAPDLAGHLEIVVTPGPAAPLDGATAALLGNVVLSSQGEAVTGELLGSGDASVPNQRFKIAKPPVTRVPKAGAPHGGESTLVVRVAGVQWTEVEYLYGNGPTARVFVVETDDDGAEWVRFGDGTIGALVPTGAQVTADYRTGLGTAGNVGAGLLTTALTKPKGLNAVDNSLPASGGGDPETIDEARTSAPTTVRTFERIVSLQDAADQARENAMVGKATSAWTTVGDDVGVLVTVAGADGSQLGALQLADVQADLDARRDPNRPLVVRGYTPVALTVSVSLIALDPAYAPKDVQAAVGAALLARFAFAVRDFGEPVVLSEVYVAAQAVPGVVGVHVDGLTFADPAVAVSHFVGSGPLQERLDLNAEELATLAAADLTVTVAA